VSIAAATNGKSKAAVVGQPRRRRRRRRRQWVLRCQPVSTSRRVR